MRARYLRAGPLLLLLATGLLLFGTARSPAAAQAPRQTARHGAPAPLWLTVTPGPTTAPPELSLTGNFTTTCDLQAVTVTLSIANTSNVNSPADTTLVVTLPGLGIPPGVLGHINLISVSSIFPSAHSYSPTLNGFMLTIGAIEAHAHGQVTIALAPSPVPGNGNIGVLSAYLAEVGGSGEVLSTPLTLPLQQNNYCPTPTPTRTGLPTNTATATVTPTQTQAPSATPSPTNTSLSAPPPPSSTTAPPPPSTKTPLPPSAPPPAPTGTLAPTSTAVPVSVTHPAPPSATPLPTATPKTVVIYKTVTRYKTVKRYKTIKRYQTVKRYQTIVRYKTVYRTQVAYRTRVRYKVLQAIHTVVNHKTVVHFVTRVRYRTVIRHRTKVSIVYAVRVLRHPTTGRFAMMPARVSRLAMPKPDAYMSIPRLGVHKAPVWTRGYTTDGAGGLTYDIVPYYGVTRFAYSVPFGVAGTTMAYGHDDIGGSIFHYLGTMKVGDVIVVTTGHHRFTFVVRSVGIVRPDDVGMLSAPRTRPTLALISCTPYWVDSMRVVVIAQLA